MCSRVKGPKSTPLIHRESLEAFPVPSQLRFTTGKGHRSESHALDSLPSMSGLPSTLPLFSSEKRIIADLGNPLETQRPVLLGVGRMSPLC